MKNLSSLNVRVILFILLISGLFSCNPVYYPNSINSPMLNNKGEGQANLLVSTGGCELQTAYAVTNNFGLMLNGSYLSSTKKDTIKETRTLAELGLGYTYKFSELGKFEIFGGGGFGKVPADFKGSTYNGTQRADLLKFFIQPALGLSSKAVDLSIASRFVSVKIGNETNLFIEPELVAKLGYKNIKFIGTVGFSIPQNKSSERKWDHNPFMIGIGLHYDFGRKYTE